MAIFGRDETQDPASTSPQPPSQPRPTSSPSAAQRVTLISAGTTIQGEVTGATEIKIEGAVDGTLNVDALVTVASGGQVRGEIRARSVAVSGAVIGNILGGDNVEIHSSGKLEGDVKAPRVSIADGAYFKGRVEMTDYAPAPDAKPVAKPIAPAATKPTNTADSSGQSSSQPTLDTIKTGEPSK